MVMEMMVFDRPSRNSTDHSDDIAEVPFVRLASLTKDLI
jgi:hypothetical protein